MNALRNFMIGSFLVCSVLPGFAADDLFLRIQDSNGYTRVIPLDAKRAITKIENFKAGIYTFTLTNRIGQALKIGDKPMRRWATVKLSAQTTSESYANAVIANAMGTPTEVAACTECSREIYIEKQVAAGSTFSETIEIGKDGILLIDFGGNWSDGRRLFANDWETQENQESMYVDGSK